MPTELSGLFEIESSWFPFDLCGLKTNSTLKEKLGSGEGKCRIFNSRSRLGLQPVHFNIGRLSLVLLKEGSKLGHQKYHIGGFSCLFCVFFHLQLQYLSLAWSMHRVSESHCISQLK